MNSWRDRARRAIDAALATGRDLGLEGKALEEHVRKAYPFGERANHPYRVWLDECRRVLEGDTRTVRAFRRKDDPGQGDLFQP